MAVKKIVSRKGTIETKVAERISQQFDKSCDVKNTFTFRIMSNMRGKADDAVRAAVQMALKKSNSKSANIKVRFTKEFAETHIDELIELAKTVQLENEARIYELREHLSEEVQKQGKLIAKQNYALMLAKTMVSSSVREDTLNQGLRNTGNWYIPETSVFHLELDFAGISEDEAGFNIEKKINITNDMGESFDVYRVITQVGGAKACPVTVNNKDIMADMLYDILSLYDQCFNNVDGADMEQLLAALKDYVSKYRIHNNTQLIDTSLSVAEKDECKIWAEKAITWIRDN